MTYRLNKYGIILGIFLLMSPTIIGQESPNIKTQKLRPLIPDYAKLQFAGGIGFLSLGLGYSFLRKN